jgi:hypothetical protein
MKSQRKNRSQNVLMSVKDKQQRRKEDAVTLRRCMKYQRKKGSQNVSEEEK